MNDEMFRLSLIDFMKKNLLNEFVNNVFEYNLKDDEYVYMQYKIVNNTVVVNIYDNSVNNRFKAFIFTNNDIVSNDNNVLYINVNDCHALYKKNVISNKLNLLGALLKEKDNDEKKKIISYLDDSSVKSILLKHFTV